MYKFELQKGSKKYNCPSCSNKRFVRYVNQQTNEHISFDVGRCDRESSCGYHFTPKMYFAQNSEHRLKAVNKRSLQGFTSKNGSQTTHCAGNMQKSRDFIPNDYLLRTLTNYEQNAFVQFLLNLFPNCFDEVSKAIKDYLIGTTKDGRTIFWQIDQKQRICTGKIIAYDVNTGKRRKDIFPNWIHAELKKVGLKNDFNLNQCFFGEHLLIGETEKPVAIVEAEKTAVVASICFPEFVWLAIGSKQNLKAKKLKLFGQRKIVLYPDADGFTFWQEIASQARLQSLDVRVSDLIEKHGTDAEKGKGFDLADYLIYEQRIINKYNSFVDFYNCKLEKVLSNEKLFCKFEMILDKQKFNIMLNDKISEMEAERKVTNLENLRRIVLSL